MVATSAPSTGSTTLTERESKFAMYTADPSGATARLSGVLPTDTVIGRVADTGSSVGAPQGGDNGRPILHTRTRFGKLGAFSLDPQNSRTGDLGLS
jgi:hypothetical protein